MRRRRQWQWRSSRQTQESLVGGASGGGGVKAASAYFLPSLFPPPIVQVRERLIAMRKQSSLDDVSVVRREGEGRAAKDRVLFRTRAPALTIRAGSTPTP